MKSEKKTRNIDEDLAREKCGWGYDVGVVMMSLMWREE